MMALLFRVGVCFLLLGCLRFALFGFWFGVLFSGRAVGLMLVMVLGFAFV